jgi:pimeloyl-ACP methyl ester carboxylesterase
MTPVDPVLVRDVVVVVPGIMGSELVDARNRTIWSVSAGSLCNAIRSLGNSLRRLQLDEGIDDNTPVGDKAMTPTRLVGSLHVIPGLWSPITGYDGLLNFLRSARFHLIEQAPGRDDRIPNLIPFPYDWRLSNRYNGKRLAEEAVKALNRWRKQPGMSDAKLVLVCHSMGGLVARWFAEKEGGADFIRAMITVGTPHRGALNSLVTLENGLEPGIGPLRFSLTDFARSLPAMYQLLPQYNCVVIKDGRKDLLTAGYVNLDPKMLKDAFDFHAALAGDKPPSYPLYKVVGIRQPTATTARYEGNRVVADEGIDGHYQGGDGTVPLLAAQPVAGRGSEVHEIASQHGELQGTRALLDLLDGILSRREIIWQAAALVEGFGVQMQEVWDSTEQPFIRVTDTDGQRMSVQVQDETGAAVGEPVAVSADGTANLGTLGEGGYCAVVSSTWRGGPRPVTKPFLVFNSATQPQGGTTHDQPSR